MPRAAAPPADDDDSGFPATIQEPLPGVAASSSDEDDDSPLFRPEVMAGRRPRLAGEVLLGARPLWNAVTLIALLLAGALVLLVAQGSYTRRATVGGQLVPVQGVMRIVAPQGATVIEQRVREGQPVPDLQQVLPLAAGAGALGRRPDPESSGCRPRSMASRS